MFPKAYPFAQLNNAEKHRDNEGIKAVGMLIRAARLKKSVSQQELANECDVELSTINRFELGKMSPSLSMLFLIAAKLEVSPKDLMPD